MNRRTIKVDADERSTPKAKPRSLPAENKAMLREVSQTEGYGRPERIAPQPTPEARRRKAAATVQMNIRCEESLKARFDAICHENEWKQGTVLRKAIEALEEKLGAG